MLRWSACSLHDAYLSILHFLKPISSCTCIYSGCMECAHWVQDSHETSAGQDRASAVAGKPRHKADAERGAPRQMYAKVLWGRKNFPGLFPSRPTAFKGGGGGGEPALVGRRQGSPTLKSVSGAK